MAAAAALVTVTLQLLLLSSASVSAQDSDLPHVEVTVDTRSGPVLGWEVSTRPLTGNDQRVRQFLGIPYAKPPLGELRFRPPEEVTPWQEPHQATSLADTCIQHEWAWTRDDLRIAEFYKEGDTKRSEDCLYLNLWVPANRNLRKPPAALVFIHGGGLNVGSAALKLYDGKILAASKNVIVAVIQYRLGAFGFLSFGTEAAPGNVGLMDQQMALKWLKENIGTFGGDPDRITIFGESAGGASVNYHLLTPESRKYFRRGIMHSGSATSFWASMEREQLKKASLERARVAGCEDNEDDLDTVLECLYTADADKVGKGGPLVKGDLPLQFLPAKDENFLPGTPHELLEKGDFYKTDLMLGYNSNEGTLMLNFVMPDVYPSSGEFDIDEATYRKSFDGVYFAGSAVQKEALAIYYRDWLMGNSSDAFVSSLDTAAGDHWFGCPMAEVAERYAEANQATYFYYFTYRGALSVMKPWGGATHTDELPYVFGLPLLKRLNSNSDELQLAETMMTMWANFAQTGNPNSGDIRGRSPVTWNRRTPKGYQYLTITANPASMVHGVGPHVDNCAMWEYLARTDVQDSCPSSSVRYQPMSALVIVLLLVCLKFV